MSYRSCLTVSVLRSSSDVSFACFFVVLFMYILVGVLVNSLSEKLREIWNVFKGLLHLAWVCHIIRGFCLVIESRHLLLVCVDRCTLIVGNLFRACRVVEGILSFSVMFSINLNALFCTFWSFCVQFLIYCLMEWLSIEVAVLRLLSRVFFCFSQINSWSVVVLLKFSLPLLFLFQLEWKCRVWSMSCLVFLFCWYSLFLDDDWGCVSSAYIHD